MKHAIETDRLLLQPFQLHDLAVLHETFTNPHVRKFLWDDQIIDREQTREILTINENHFAMHHWGLWKMIVKGEKAYAGFAGLWIFFEEHQPQLLYGLLPEYTHLGYATEASKSALAYAFDMLSFPFVIASFDSANVESAGVCKRLKMVFVKEEIVNGKLTTFYQANRKKEVL